MSVWISDEKLLIFASLISPSKTILFEKKLCFDILHPHLLSSHCYNVKKLFSGKFACI